MVEIRVIFGDDDRGNEQFLGFYLDNIEEAEERYIRQLDVLNDFDSDIKFPRYGIIGQRGNFYNIISYNRLLFSFKWYKVKQIFLKSIENGIRKKHFFSFFFIKKS
jgi:hypothetical protein